MVAHAPILVANATDERGSFVDTFIADKKSAWKKIATMIMTHEVLTYAEGACKSLIGRAAFLSIFDHYHGSNTVGHMVTKAERMLSTTSYSSEKNS